MILYSGRKLNTALTALQELVKFADLIYKSQQIIQRNDRNIWDWPKGLFFFRKYIIKQLNQGSHLLFQCIYSSDLKKKGFCARCIYFSQFSSLTSLLASLNPIWQPGRDLQQARKKKNQETWRKWKQQAFKRVGKHRGHKLGTSNTWKHKYLHILLCSQNNLILKN